MKNAINWFEIPVQNYERGIKFYETIFGFEMYRMPMGGNEMAFFPCDREGVGGALVYGNGYKPSADGTLVFLNGGDDLSTVLNKVEAAGGAIVVPKTQVTEEIGYFGIFIDTEGNKVALHSQK